MFYVDDMRNGYDLICRYVVERGERYAPRGQATRELTGQTIVVPSVEDAECMLPLSMGRGVSRAIAALEALQLISGRSYPDLMVQASQNFAQFRDGGAFHGAYGPRLRMQMQSVIDKINKDPSTRQAVVTIWDPLHDMQGGRNDIPCTVTMQFLVRHETIELHVYMRSNDVWWGLAYDAFQFTQLQAAVGRTLGIPSGKYVHHVGSLHVYERDIESAMSMELAGLTEAVPKDLGINVGDWNAMATYANLILQGSGGGEWWRNALHGLTRG